jgi:hypothetical protein
LLFSLVMSVLLLGPQQPAVFDDGEGDVAILNSGKPGRTISRWQRGGLLWVGFLANGGTAGRQGADRDAPSGRARQKRKARRSG